MRLGQSLLATVNRYTLLQSCPICSSLGEDALAPIATITSERLFNAGELIAQEGDPSAGFYLILEGKIRVFKASSSGREKVLLVAEPGMTFGEEALFGTGHWMENAIALEKTRALHVPRIEFLNILRNNPELAFQVMESLCLWIRRLSNSVENAVFLKARDKVGRYLLDLWKQGSSKTNVTLPGKKLEIADRLGITPETLSRILHEFQEQRMIKIEKRNVRFTDIQQLQEVVQS